MTKQKKGTLEYYLEMSDKDFESEMDKFEEWLEEEKEENG